MKIGPMTSALILEHDALYPAARLVGLLRDFGIPCDVRRLHAREAVPVDLDETRLLVLLGGTMRTVDVGDERFPFLSQSLEAAKAFVDADRPVLGIGFGAELLSMAAGAKVAENRKPDPSNKDAPGEPAPEFGWTPVTFPFPGGVEPAVFGLIDGAPFFNWHTDTFALPAFPPPAVPPKPPARAPTGNALMASSRVCKNQAYRYKNRIFGFQFHFELDRTDIDQIVQKRSIEAQLSSSVVSKINADTNKFHARYERAGVRIVQNLVQFLKAY